MEVHWVSDIQFVLVENFKLEQFTPKLIYFCFNVFLVIHILNKLPLAYKLTHIYLELHICIYYVNLKGKMCCCNASIPQYLYVELVAQIIILKRKKQKRNHFTSSIHRNYQFYFTFLWTFIFAICFSDPWSFL